MGIFRYLTREVMRRQPYGNGRHRRSGWGLRPPPRRHSTWGDRAAGRLR